MSVIVTDTGFGQDDLVGLFQPVAENPAAAAVVLPSDFPLQDLPSVVATAQSVAIEFPSFSDGRGFTLARLLRLQGFKGRLRARGHVISDQYAMARRSGFDEVEISDALAQRQPQAEWLNRANHTAHDYQSRLRG